MKATILVAESNPSIRALLRDLLEGAGWRVETAAACDEAVSKAAQSPPDAALVEHGLLDGRGRPVETAFPWRERGVQLILLVDGAMDDPLAAVAACAARTYLRRPIDRSRLLDLVRQATDHAVDRCGDEAAQGLARYRSVCAALRDAVLILDGEDGAVLDCNAAAARIYGHSQATLRTMTFADLSEDGDRMADLVRSRTPRLPVVSHRRKGGKTFPVEASLDHFVHGGRAMTAVVVRDASHRKVVEAALREGARLYRAVVEDQTELICRYTPDGVLSFANGAFARFFGVDEDAVMGTPYFPRLAANERRDLKSWIRNVGPDSPAFERDQQVERGDGEVRWIRWTNRALYDRDGRVAEVQSVGRDITDRKAAQAAAAEADARSERYRRNLEATFRSIPDAIVTVDAELRVMTCNAAVEAMFGVNHDEIHAASLDAVLGSSGHPCVNVLRQVIKTNRPVRGYEIELIEGDDARMVELNCTPLVDEDVRRAGAVLVARDVTRIADLEKRLHERPGFRGIVGRSPAMQDVYRLLEQLSSLDSTVLILGESGTGKELAAEALHYGGDRAGRPLVKVNCSALSESLLESELFGHVKGAFTGAVRDKAGRIQAAEGGTLFLDEIGDVSPLIQLKLLRFLERKEYERVGESATLSADVRILAATNVDLRAAASRGEFREDLYYRLNVMPVHMPPLRDRRPDIPLLTEHFLETFAGQFDKSFLRVSDAVMDLLMRYEWPGNVRELRHALEHACILCPGGQVGMEHMRRDFMEQLHGSDAAAQPAPTSPQPIYSAAAVPAPIRRRVDRQAVVEALARTGGNKAMAARQLGIHRATLYRKLAAEPDAPNDA